MQLTGSLALSGSIILTGSISTEGQPPGTVASASYAITASYVETAQTASYITASNIDGLPASDPFPYTGTAIILGNQEVSGSVGFSYGVIVAGWSAGGALITGR